MAMAAPSPVAPPVTSTIFPSKSPTARSFPLGPSQHAQGVIQYLGVIEGQLQARLRDHPLDRAGVIAGLGRGAPHPREKCNGAGMPARIAPRLRIDADQLERAGIDARLLHQL